MFAKSSDGTGLAYDVSENYTGPALLLLQGLEESRSAWRKYGYLDKLSRYYTVITMDRRGIGDSDLPDQSEYYAVDRLLEDVIAVADACDVETFMLWGHSFGGSIALQLAARSRRVERVVVAGSFFGRVYPEERVQEIVGMWTDVLEARTAGNLDSLDLDVEERGIIESTNIPALLACWSALTSRCRPRCPTRRRGPLHRGRRGKPLESHPRAIGSD